MPKISICIPTYHRVDLLRKAIDSCLSQTKKPYEILIGDDSRDCESQKMVVQIQNSISDVNIRYFHNEPSMGQAANVAHLFSKSQGEYIVLLHDDDELEPSALQSMHKCFALNDNIIAVYGKQHFIYEDGSPFDNSENLNTIFYRNDRFEGLQTSTLKMAVLQQFPNDGYMIKAHIVQQVNYKELPGEDAVDFFFAVAVAEHGLFYFLNQYTAKYRVMTQAVSKKSTNNAGYMSFRYVYNHLRRQDEQIEQWLTNKAAVAIVQAANIKDHKNAWQWFFGKYHRSKILTFGGVKRFLIIVKSLLS